MENTTVAEIVRAYLKHSASQKTHCPAVREDREYSLGLFVTDFGDRRVADLKPYMLTDWIEAHETWKSSSTRRAKANQVKACFNWALKQERIGRNPFKTVTYSEAERRAEMDDETFEKVCRVASKPFERAVRFLRLTGCRAGELCRATWDQMDLDKGTWSIPIHKSRKFTGRPKLVALVGEAVALVRSIPREGERIFLNSRGRPWHRWSLANALERIRKRYGLAKGMSLHGLRHRMASAAIAAGAPLKLVAAQLGHATTAITERYYCHIGEGQVEQMRSAAELGRPAA